MKKRFLPREHKKRKFMKQRWRKPKGHHSKMRRRERHQAKMPGTGFKSPESKRGMHPSGFKPVVISNEKEIQGIDKKLNAIYLSGRLGMRKKVELTKTAQKMGFKVLNPKSEKKKEVRKGETKPAKKTGK